MRLHIKEFADFCNVSVRALHLYDKMDLFKPSFIDVNNGYRYYETDQMLELNTILSFKKVGFALKEIKEMKDHAFSKEAIIEKLHQKQRENERIIEIAAYNNENISEMLKGLQTLEVGEGVKEEEEALKVSKIACLENEKLEHDFSQIMWL